MMQPVLGCKLESSHCEWHAYLSMVGCQLDEVLLQRLRLWPSAAQGMAVRQRMLHDTICRCLKRWAHRGAQHVRFHRNMGQTELQVNRAG